LNEDEEERLRRELAERLERFDELREEFQVLKRDLKKHGYYSLAPALSP